MKMVLLLFLHSCTLHMIDPHFNFNKLPEKIPFESPEKTDPKKNGSKCPLFDSGLTKSFKLGHLSTSFLLNNPKPNKMGEFPCYIDKIEEIVKLDKFKPLDKVESAEAWLRAELAVFFADNIIDYIHNLELRLSEQDRLIYNRDFSNVKCASESIKLLMGSKIDELSNVDKELAQFFIYEVESETKSN